MKEGGAGQAEGQRKGTLRYVMFDEVGREVQQEGDQGDLVTD